MSSRWTSSPFHLLNAEVRPGIEPGLPPYRGGVLPKHLQTNLVAVIPDGIEPSLSWLSPGRLRLWTTGSISSDRGGSRTHRITRLSTSSLFQFAYPAVSARLPRSRAKLQVRGAHPAVRAYEAQLCTGSPASIRQVLACQYFSDQGETRTPTPRRARRSERRVFTDYTTWPGVTRAGIEPALPA